MIRAFDITPLKNTLEVEGIDIAETLRFKAPKASGALKASYLSRTEANGQIITINIHAASHHIFVERGRGKNKRMPPIENIRKWCKQKGIDVNYAWPIAKKIAEDGIEAKAILDETIARKLPTIKALITDVYFKQMNFQSRNMMDELFPRKR
jgi:hypothetical protein